MNIFMRPPMRSGSGAAIPTTLSSAAVSLFGVQVTRHQILRVSALLTLRTLATLVDLPLHDSVASYLWSFLFSSAQAGVAFAAAASVLDSGGAAGRFASRLLFSSADGPFVRLYARAVTVAGPLCALFETAVLVFELMALARAAEDAMDAAERRDPPLAWPRRALVALAATLVAAAAALVAAAGQIYGPAVALAASAFIAFPLVVGFAVETANVVEAAAVALLAAVIGWLGICEETALPSPFLRELVVPAPAAAAAAAANAQFPWAMTLFQRKDPVEVIGFGLQSDEARAAVLVLTLASLFVGIGRGRRFVRVLAIGGEEVQREELYQSGGLHSEQQQQQQQLYADARVSDRRNDANNDDTDYETDDDDDDDGDNDDVGSNHSGIATKEPRERRRRQQQQQRRQSSGDTAAGQKRENRFAAPPQHGASVSRRDATGTLLSVVTLLGATFRLLVWCGQLRSGEYFGGPCRLCQMFASVILYLMFAQM